MKSHFHLINYILLFVLTGITLALSLYVPTYIDDITCPILANRAGYDGWHIIGVWPLCKNNFDTEIPLTFLPGRLLAWLAYYPLSTPITTRLFGIVSFLCWLLSITWMIKKSSVHNTSWLQSVTLPISLGFLGVLPFMATLTRPETLLATAIVFFSFIPFYIEKTPPNIIKYTSLFFLHLLISSWFFSAHPKAFFFIPLALYSMGCLIKRTKLGIPGIFILLLMTFQAYQYWAYRMNCPYDVEMQRLVVTTTLLPELIFTDPFEFIKKFWDGVAGSADYLDNVLFAPSYGSGWLPPVFINENYKITNLLITGLIIGILLFWITSASKLVISTWKKKKFLGADFAVPFFLLSGMILVAGLQQSKNFYDSVFIWLCGICLTAIFLMRSSFQFPRWVPSATLAILLPISLVSQLTLFHTFEKLPEINQNADINGVLENEDKSASMLNYPARQQRIIDFAARCNIDPQKPNNYLIVDMFTYFPFKASYRPVYVKHLRTFVIPFAKVKQSTGLIALCSSLPPNVENLSVQDSGLCCMSKEAINNANNY